jgi:hypothetical protein
LRHGRSRRSSSQVVELLWRWLLLLLLSLLLPLPLLLLLEEGVQKSVRAHSDRRGTAAEPYHATDVALRRGRVAIRRRFHHRKSDGRGISVPSAPPPGGGDPPLIVGRVNPFLFRLLLLLLLLLL